MLGLYVCQEVPKRANEADFEPGSVQETLYVPGTYCQPRAMSKELNGEVRGFITGVSHSVELY